VQAIQKAVQEVAQPGASVLEFHTDAETGRVVVKITDSATGELVRQIPMEEMLALAKSLDRLQGLLFQTKA
jgi:flagellar protein FlaG